MSSKKARYVINGQEYYTEDEYGRWASIYRDLDGPSSRPVYIDYGHGWMPAHNREQIEPTVEAIEAKMRSIADLRKWVEPRE